MSHIQPNYQESIIILIMLAFGARVVGIELAKMIVDAWLTGEYEGGRHQVRIDMLKEIEERQKSK